MLAKLNLFLIRTFGPVTKSQKRQIVEYLIKECQTAYSYSCVYVYDEYGAFAVEWYTTQLRNLYCQPRGLNTMNPFFKELEDLQEYSNMTLNYRDQLVVSKRQKWLHYLLDTLWT